MFARDFGQSVLVLLHQVILFWPAVYNVVAWDDHERSLTTNGAGPEVFFSGAFVIGGSPAPYALETEGVVARVENSELLAFGEHGLQTDLTLLVVLFDVGLLLSGTGEIPHIAALGVQKLALVAVPAIVVDEVLANDLLFVTVDEVLNQGIFVVLHVL